MIKTNTFTPSRFGRVVAGVCLALGVGACSVPVPEFTPPPVDAEVHPVLDEQRLDDILAQVNDVLAKADEDADKGELSPRIEGRAKQMRAWEYARSEDRRKAEVEEPRSEERRVGKEGRGRRAGRHGKH